jgi:hypothetical protein
MSNKYPNSGVLFYAKNKVHPKSPDLTGDITFERHFLRNLLNEIEGDEIKIRLSAWQKEGNYGPFFTMSVNTYKKEEAPAPRQDAPPPADEKDLPF